MMGKDTSEIKEQYPCTKTKTISLFPYVIQDHLLKSGHTVVAPWTTDQQVESLDLVYDSYRKSSHQPRLSLVQYSLTAELWPKTLFVY